MSALPGNDAEVEVQLQESVGQRLRAAREALNLPRAEAAAALHLGESVIEALEQNDRERLPDPVFVQGYLRKYARLLNVSEDPILNAYGHHPIPQQKKKGGLAGSPLRPEIRSNHAAVRLVTWLIVFGLVALVVTWWWGYLQWPTSDPESTGQTVDLEAPLIGEPGELEEITTLPGELVLEQDFRGPMEEEPEPEAEMEASMPEEEALAEVAGIAQSRVVGVELSDTAEATSVIKEEPVADVAEEQPIITSEEPVVSSVVQEIPATADTDPAAEPIDYENSIVIEFSSNCWTDIRDATATFKLLGNMQMGEKHVLGGEPPYSVILGNSRAVTLTIKGQPYDVEQHSRGNVARFTLHPEEIPDN